MAIPASVTLYVNWTNGQPLSSGTYTAVTPDKPNAHTWSFASGATLAQDNNSPWNGRYLANVGASFEHAVTSTVSSSTVQATSGRFYFECTAWSPSGSVTQFALLATSPENGRIRVRNVSGNIVVGFDWNGFGSFAEVNLGTRPTNPYAVEVIYDSNNGTANQRLRARMWELSGSAGSFTNATSTGGGAATTDQFTSLYVGDNDGNGTPSLQYGRVAFSNDTTEDLSNLDESSGGGAAVYAFQGNGFQVGQYKATATTSYSLTVDSANLTPAGATVGLKVGRKLAVVAGNITPAGGTVGLKVGRKLPVVAGAPVLTGGTVALKVARILPVTAANLTLGGGTVALGKGFRLTVDAGSLTPAGGTVALRAARVLPVAAGSLTPAGGTVGLKVGRKLPVVAGGLTPAGGTVALKADRKLAVTAGGIAPVGADVTLTYSGSGSKVLPVTAGNITLQGAEVTLTYTPAVAQPPQQAVGHVRAVGRRGIVWVKIKNGQVYEVTDEPEARKVVKAIKRKVQRQLQHAAAPIEIPQIEIEGAAPFVESLRREVADVQVKWAAVYQKLWDDADEDDVEALLL